MLLDSNFKLLNLRPNNVTFTTVKSILAIPEFCQQAIAMEIYSPYGVTKRARIQIK